MIWKVAFWSSFWSIIVVVGAVLLAAPALPDELTDRGAWFKSLKVPHGAPFAGQSCCDLADGFPAEADFRDGQWYARLLDGGRYPIPEEFRGKWIAVPPEIVLQNVQMIDAERAYLFIYRGNLRCFVPPLQGF